MLSDPVPPLTLLSAPVPVNVKLSPPVPAVRLLMPVYVNAMPPVTEPPFTVLMAQAFAAASCATRLSVPPPVRVLNPLNVRVCPPFTRVFDAPPTFQVAALPMPFCSVPPAALLRVSMALNVPFRPTLVVPLNPLAPDAVRFTVAAPKAVRSRMSVPVPPVRLPTPENARLLQPLAYVRLPAFVPVRPNVSPVLSPTRVNVLPVMPSLPTRVWILLNPPPKDVPLFEATDTVMPVAVLLA